ncbi:MAG: Type 1 glutamine amidotransferase-like domain-containing protein [Actinomycetes bacterium]
MTAGAGPLALVGSGEFLPAMLETDATLLAGRPPRVAVLATAAAPDGDAVVRRWYDLAGRHYATLDAEVVEVDVRDRADAGRADLAALVAGAGLVYLSGGKPDHLVAALRGTPVADAVVAAWRGGAALAGCSAGAMALAAGWPSFVRAGGGLQAGLGVVPGLAVVPHFDRFVSWRRRWVDRVGAERPAGVRVVGIDEDTALVWDPAGGWRVTGVGGVHELAGGPPVPLGDTPDLPVPA